MKLKVCDSIGEPKKHFITSPAGPFAKYYNERVCVSQCVCLCICLLVREHISRTARAIFTKFLCMLPIAVARSSSNEVTKSQGKGATFGVFYPVDNALYIIAFGIHTQTAETIEMPFGLMTRAGPRYYALDGDPDPKGKGQFWGKT